MINPAEYGFFESNPLPAGMHDQYRDAREVDWSHPGLKMTRLRMLTDPGHPMYDISYAYGKIGDEYVVVILPFHQLTKRRWKSEIIDHAKREGIFAKGLGIFDCASILC